MISKHILIYTLSVLRVAQ